MKDMILSRSVRVVHGAKEALQRSPQARRLLLSALPKRVLLAKLRANLDRALLVDGLTRDDFFGICRQTLSDLGFENTSTTFFDERIGRFLRTFDGTAPDFQELSDFAASGKLVQYRRGRILLKIAASEEGSFIFAARGGQVFAGRGENIRAACALIAQRIGQAFSSYSDLQEFRLDAAGLKGLLLISDRVDDELSGKGGAGVEEASIVRAAFDGISGIFPRIRSASVLLWDKETETLVPAATLGVEHGHLGEPDSFSLAKQVLLEKKNGITEDERNLTAFIQQPRFGEFMLEPFYAEDGAPLGVVCLSYEAGRHLTDAQRDTFRRFVQILQRKLEVAIHIRELEWAGKHDGLTGLLNHKTGMDILATSFAGAAKGDHPISLLMVDLDHFKQVNDVYGHKAGDFVLKQLSAIMRGVADDLESIVGTGKRIGAYVVRYGGEEFHIVLVGASREDAAKIGLALKERIAAHEFDIGFGRTFLKTASIGVATASSGGNVNELVEVADRAMYCAKNNGRNRVAVADGDDGTIVLD